MRSNPDSNSPKLEWFPTFVCVITTRLRIRNEFLLPFELPSTYTILQTRAYGVPFPPDPQGCKIIRTNVFVATRSNMDQGALLMLHTSAHQRFFPTSFLSFFVQNAFFCLKCRNNAKTINETYAFSTLSNRLVSLSLTFSRRITNFAYNFDHRSLTRSAHSRQRGGGHQN